LTDVHTEIILSLKPDLILMSGNSQAQRDRLVPLGLRLESVPDTTLADIYTAVRTIGEFTQRDEAAEALCRRMELQIVATDEAFRETPPRRVLLLIDTLADPPRPPTVAGGGSFYDDLLKRAGHENVASDVAAAFGRLSLEAIVHADPDVIIELDPDGTVRPNGAADALRVWSKMEGLSAVRNKRVHVLTGPVYYLPGPRVPRIYADLCKAIASGD
jgi:iron complex transport system substrate-binding protein